MPLAFFALVPQVIVVQRITESTSKPAKKKMEETAERASEYTARPETLDCTGRRQRWRWRRRWSRDG